ncbi:hypothetical protein SUGI_0973680 [Cryptomeria japonica]|nr:hypothetical protein SUGI_0973680 [Cryptomeria japonica]
MDMAGVDPSPIEVELDAIGYAWKCCWEADEVLNFGCKGVDDGFCVEFFPLSPIEVEIMNSKFFSVVLTLRDKFVGALTNPIVMVEGALIPMRMFD